MATKDYSTPVLTNEDVLKEIYALVPRKFPVTVSVVNGQVVKFSYETEWKTGGTELVKVEHKDKKGNLTYTDEYQDNYKAETLTKAEIAKLDKWASENIG